MRVAALLCLVVVICLGGPVLLQDEPALLTGFHDDAFYYLQIARNLAGGNGFTFDGIHRTNGFHPLWLFLVTSVYLPGPGPVVALRAVAMLETLLAAAAVALIFLTMRRRAGSGAAAVAALLVVALPGAREALRYGMEGSLILFLLVLVWNRWLAATADGTASTARWLGVGAACALAFLARLEAGLIMPFMILFFRRRLPASPAARLGLTAPMAVTVAAYLIWNRLVFGLWLPVSGMIKSYQTAMRPAGSWLSGLWEIPWAGHELLCRLWGCPVLSRCPPAAQALHGLLVAALIGVLWWRRRFVGEALRSSGVGLPLMVSAGMIAADVRLVRFLYPWARVPIFLATALFCGALLHRHHAAARRIAVVMGLAAATILPLRVLGADSPSTRFPLYRALAARWIDEHLPPDQRVGSWNAGTLGYFAGRPVVNLDGLVNDRHFYERVILGSDLEGYLRDERITWLADQGCGPQPRPHGYLDRTSSSALDDRFELAAAFYNLDSPDGCPGYAIWRLN